MSRQYHSMPATKFAEPVAVKKVKDVGDGDSPIKPSDKMKEEEVDPSTLKANLNEVFSLGYIPLDRFSKKLKEALELAKKKKVAISKIDFGRDGYVTDAVIKTLVKTVGQSALAGIQLVSLEGCGILTDVGLHWLLEALEESGSSNSIEVNINGCTKVTDGGLALLANSKRVNTIQAMATSVSHLRFLGNTKGCPLLANPKKVSVQTEKQSYVIIVPMGTKHSLAQFIELKAARAREPFHCVKDLALKDWKINIMEAERNHVLFEYLMPPNPVHVIIPFDASCDVKQLKAELVDTVAHVLSKERLNPKHQVTRVKGGSGGSGFMNRITLSKCAFSSDGILRNTSNSENVIGAVISNQPLSRSNSYYEVAIVTTGPDTGLIIGIMHDILITQRFPLDSKESNGGVVDGFELDEGAVYGFGVEGEWDSEYVPSAGSVYYYTKNGVKLKDKEAKEKPQSGMHPIVSVMGKNFAAIKLLNVAFPPEPLLHQWESKGQCWSPGFMHNMLCDDRGVLSYKSNYSHSSDCGIMMCQQEITREHNTFSLKCLRIPANGIITLGIGPETYNTNRQPGWDKSSLALHGDNGQLYLSAGSGVVPSSGTCHIWKVGDIVSAVVTSLGEEDTIQVDSQIEVDFYVNSKLMANVKYKMSGLSKGIRFVFMVGLQTKTAQAQMMQYRPIYMCPSPCMDKLTMGRANFINIYDDGRLAHRRFDKRDIFSLYLSKTPLNKKLTYFEMTVNKLGNQKHCGIGLAPMEYPINNMVGWKQGSLGYHADNGQAYINSSSGVRSLVTEPGNSAPAAYGAGDTVGCGIDTNKAKFREDGSLENQQELKVYFTKNGKKVHEINFKYQSDGIYPAVNLHFEPDEVVLSNYYHGNKAGEIIVDEKKPEKPETENEEELEKFVEGCRFTVVGLGDEKSDPKGKTKILEQMLQTWPGFPMTQLIDSQLQLMDSNPRTMDLQGQQMYGQLCWQKECLERFSKSKDRLKFMSVDPSSEKNHQELIDLIVSICEADLAHHNKFYELDELVVAGLQKITDKLQMDKLITSNTLESLIKEELGQNGRVYEAAVRFMQSKGCLLWVPMKRTVLAIDLDFAETLTSMSKTVSDTLSGNMAPCIGTETRVWADIADILPELKSFVQSKKELLSHALMFFGVMEIPRLRVKKNDPMYCYCTRTELGKLPIALEEFIPSDDKDVVLMQRDYHFLYSDPVTILSTVVCRCLLFSNAVAISQKWSVFQNSAAQTVVYVHGDKGLRVETRCFMPSKLSGSIDFNTKHHVEEYTFHVFCIFTDLIDLIITRLKLKVFFTQKVPQGLVNSSIGCIHNWVLSNEDYRQTLCTLCGRCCDKGKDCPYNGVEGQYQHQCGCNTLITGCKDCGICQACAELLWTIRSYIRPNCEVASYGKMKSNQYIPLNATTYDEVEITNLGFQQPPVCLKGHTGLYYQSYTADNSQKKKATSDDQKKENDEKAEDVEEGTFLFSRFSTVTSRQKTSDTTVAITKMFPGLAIEYPGISALEEGLKQSSRHDHDKMMKFEQGDTVTIRLDPIKRDPKTIEEEEEEAPPEISPVYFTAICREVTIWHDAGIVAYTSTLSSVPVGQFISALPLTPECPSFSFEIVCPGAKTYIAIGLCPKRYSSNRQPGWNSGSFGYHADDGGVYIGSGGSSRNFEKCTTGDVMKCEISFDNQKIHFYKNDTMIFSHGPVRNIRSLHAAVGFHSVGEAVRLLEKEPWQMKADEETHPPAAFDSYNYGNMFISPGRTLTLTSAGKNLVTWLMLHNPSKSVIGLKIFPSHMFPSVKILGPGQSMAERISISSDVAKELFYVDIHWFLLESNRDYSSVDIGQIYNMTTSESLLKHRLKVRTGDHHSTDAKPLKLASELPDNVDAYLAEVFKNGICVQKYWLKKGNYVCSIPLECNVLVRYPKFPTLDQPNQFQKGMRVILDLTESYKDVYAEAIIEEVMQDGLLRLEYSLAGEAVNSCMEIPGDSDIINIQEIEYENVVKPEPNVDQTDGGDSDTKQETKRVALLNISSFEHRGNVATAKRAYMFPPSHLLTQASQEAITTMDSEWKSNSLQSVAQCKMVPTRLTVQELQISLLLEGKVEWLQAANPTKKLDLAFAFLPSNLGQKSLCYPVIPTMFTQIDVHRLCFLVDQMYYNMRIANDYDIILDAPVHFVNIAPITPNPVLSLEYMYASGFNAWTYSTLYSNRLYLPHCDNVFPQGRPDFERHQLELLMKSLIHIYTAQCHIFAEQYGGVMFQTTPEDGTSTITSAIQHSDTNVVKQSTKVILSDDKLMKKTFRNNVFCKAHQWCLSSTNVVADEELDFRREFFSPYEETVNVIFSELPNLTRLPEDFFTLFPNLQYLKLQSCDNLKNIPSGISSCRRLEVVSLKNSALEELPEDLFEIPNLQLLHCCNLKVHSIPLTKIESCPLTQLILSSLLITELPKEIGCLTNLELINLNSNLLQSLPMELQKLTKLKTLNLSGIPWIVNAGSKVEIPMDQFEDFLKGNSSLTHHLGKVALIKLFHDFDHNKNFTLDVRETAALNAHLFWTVPRIGSACITDTEYGGIPPVVFMLSSLEVLNLDFQAITMVPVHMCRLQNLKTLSISNNPLLESLPGSLGHLPGLKHLRLVSNPSLRTPPHEVVSRGFLSIKAYLKRLAGGFTECRRTKLMFVGLGGAGKTSLLKALMSGSKKTAGTSNEDITDGIVIQPWTVKTSDNIEVTYSAWDFAGQTLYYNTHQFFLSKRAVYLLLWSTRQGFEHAGLEFWLSSVASHAPKTPIFVVGTHCDQVPKAEIPKTDLKERYPQIAGFHFVSSLEGTGIETLEKDLLKVTLEQKNMGEKVPQVWLNLEKKILTARSKTSILPWQVIKDFGMGVGIYDEKDIREAVQFLHELGTVQYFDNDFLRQQVVINPQWIVNVMSCVVSVKNSPIQDHSGRLLHRYIPDIWSTYPNDLHPWLLQLTEEFDLTFPLPKENVNVVPCLLPQEMPSELKWPEIDTDDLARETKMVYKFAYLPAGLFNRAQVRLFQFSDGKLIWKRGSLLKKNKHMALIQQISDSELLVKVQGPRPENVIFLIHEIFESLIEESFHGVIYDFLLPCPDCITKEGTLDPSMFEGSLVRRARENRAPFLQCRKYFHTVSMAQLYEVMPSESASDFDAHLQSSLVLMEQLNQALCTDCAIIYSSKDMAKDSDPDRINPGRVMKDLQEAGFSCWYSNDMDNIPVQDVMLALKQCKLVVPLVSDNFERDEKSHDLLLYTMDTLCKNYLIVVIGESMEWQNTNLGMRIGKQEGMVMVKNKSRYSSRVEEMCLGVRNKLQGIQAQAQQFPSVFVSYCWNNSRHAQARGTHCPSGALGWGDPREIKFELEKRGISCWLDFDQPMAGKGLFKNITEGFKHSKVLVACVSDEYVKSENCMMELRFGVLNMNLPTIICVVGTGQEWKMSEVGILTRRSKADKVYFQQENPGAMETLESYIRRQMPENADQLIQREAAKQTLKSIRDHKEKRKNADNNTSIQEEFELMQRKFMRHIISYVSSMDTVPTPRLIVVDFDRTTRETSKRESQKDMDSSDVPVRNSLVRPTLRPRTAKRSSQMMSAVIDDEAEKWESESFCLKVLCEHEEGWHVCSTSMPIKMNEELKGIMKGCSVYLGRMFAILRQSAVKLNCFEGPMGALFTHWIEQHAVDNVNFLAAYSILRSKVVDGDNAEGFLSQLHRCHLPTGKIYWLCDAHSSGPRIAKLSTESVSSSEVGRVLYEEDTKMRENLEKSASYKQKKAAAKIKQKVVLPPVDMPNPEPSSTSEDGQILMAALAANQNAIQNANQNTNQNADQKAEETSPAKDLNSSRRESKSSVIPGEPDLGKRKFSANPEATPTSQGGHRKSLKGTPSAVRSVAKANDKNSKTCILQ